MEYKHTVPKISLNFHLGRTLRATTPEERAAVQFNVNGKMVETNEQGFLCDLNDWSEDFAAMLAEHDGIELYVDHWELIWYFRDFYAETQSTPTMRVIILTLGRHRGGKFRNKKAYEKHIYGLFPTDPIHELCKLAGLPMPQPDS